MDVNGRAASDARCLEVIRRQVISHPLSHLGKVGRLAVHLKPGASRAEGMVGDESDGERIGFRAHTSLGRASPNE